MTALDELQRAVERLNRAVERLSGGMGKYGFANVYNDDVQLLLSDRAELLATVERMRGGLTDAADALDGAAAVFAIVGGASASSRITTEAQKARAALTTGEEK